MKSKYYYNGEPLIDFCKNNPGYKYNHITKYISVMLQKDPSRNPQDLIEEYINKKHRSNTKYIINGMNLSRYCELNDINYVALTKSISRAKKDSRYSDMDEDEIVNMILDKYINTEVQELDFGEPKKLTLKKTNKNS